MGDDHVCPICGEPTLKFYGNFRKDGLCTKHSRQASSGEIVQCLDCGKWNKANEECECKKVATPPTIETKNDADEISCIICGLPSNGKHFCLDCFRKFRNKELLIKVNKCNQFEIMDESYESLYVCSDGHIVKSKSERDIDNYLYRSGKRHVYEKTIQFLNEAGEKKSLKPDFYLEDLDLFIEHWGLSEKNVEYTRIKNYKLDFYRKKGYTIICTYENDEKDIDASLAFKLDNYIKNEINFLEDKKY